MKKNIFYRAIRLNVCILFFCGIYTFAYAGIAQAAPGKWKRRNVISKWQSSRI